MVNIVSDETAHQFESEGRELGRYVHNDSFKPYLEDVRTLKGRSVSLSKPHDHRHHKGLMFSFATDRANFWEEEPHELFPVIGRQVIIKSLIAAQEIRQRIHWDTPAGPVFVEDRSVSAVVDDQAVVWSWSSHLTAREDVSLIQSPWAIVTPKGKFNYHGLGLRLPRAASAMTKPSWFAKGIALDSVEILGSDRGSIAVEVLLDGEYPAARARVTMKSASVGVTAFAVDSPFAYVSMGPSVSGEVRLGRGDELACDYTVTIEDLD